MHSFKVSRYRKMEKADILDMTIKYIKATRTQLDVPTRNSEQAHHIHGLIPIQPRTENIIYDDLCKRRKEIFQHSAQKENEKNAERKVQRTSGNRESQNSAKETRILGRKLENFETSSRIVSIANDGIWRPW